jgi:mannose-6-phosphate isomerase-like protein (cupin superfamily)
MENKIKRLSEFETKEVGGHQGFMARSLVDLPGKDVTVRFLNVTPGGIGPVPAHSHRDTHFFLVLEGTLELKVDDKLYTVPSGSCVEVPPGKTHQLRCGGPKEMKVLAIKWT